MHTIRSRNVNGALVNFLRLTKYGPLWRSVSPRGKQTKEFNQPVSTVYTDPTERVLFLPERDANPFFHFFEALWILDGRSDVDFLVQFNKRMADYSDDGHQFHGAYGARLRGNFDIDQLYEVIDLLKAEPDTRRAVLQIWDATYDLNHYSKDIPCNDLVFLKLRDGKLHMSVCCRSNDVLWGAYGANAVQFSMIQEFIALSIKAEVGTYTQISDSFHYYPDTAVWEQVKDVDDEHPHDPYADGTVSSFPIMIGGSDPIEWLQELNKLLKYMDRLRGGLNHIGTYDSPERFFRQVALPLYLGWRQFKNATIWDKNTRIALAMAYIDQHCIATDWKMACLQWLFRRRTGGESELQTIETSSHSGSGSADPHSGGTPPPNCG